MMETREAILSLQYSEKMKSGLIIGTQIVEQLALLKEDEQSGGKKVLVWFLEGLRREMRIAETVLAPGQYAELESKVMEAIGRIQVSQFTEALRSFSEAISLAATFCQSSMGVLVERKLI